MPNIKNFFKTFIFLIFISTVLFSQENPPSVVSVSNPDIKVLSSKKFTWSPKSIYVYEDERFRGFPLKEVFEKDIREKLTNNGFTYVASVEDVAILVGYVLALESALSDMDINNLYEINPGFVPGNYDEDKYEKGTVIIDIIESRTNRMVWRGALQGLANFDVPEKERKKNIKGVVELLLNQFIKEYGN
ncbi:MAG: DUF4136 domain-containing protein [Thermodesulfobacteriota bacterium]